MWAHLPRLVAQVPGAVTFLVVSLVCGESEVAAIVLVVEDRLHDVGEVAEVLLAFVRPHSEGGDFQQEHAR